MVMPPPEDVVTAFGARGRPRPLDGGQGTTWQVGKIVLKPAGDPVETTWRVEVLEGLSESNEFAVAKPMRSTTGDVIVGGWEASLAVRGKEDYGRPDDVLRAGAAFHAAIKGVARPAFLDSRSDPWSYGDRMAWEEIPVAGSKSAIIVLERLGELRQPVDLPAQLVHGDLLGNVLFDNAGPPVIIDWSVYYRPTAWAAAVAVCDAITWYDAPADLLDRWAHLVEWKQLLVRAMIYRLATDDVVTDADGPPLTVIEAHRRALGLIEALKLDND